MTATLNPVITDRRGRQIRLSRPSIIAQFSLMKLIGRYGDSYIQMVLPLLFVRAVGEREVSALASDEDINILLEELGEDGVVAVMEAISDNFGPEGNERLDA